MRIGNLSDCEKHCGNKVHDKDLEECDDSNNVDDDGCSSKCVLNTLYECTDDEKTKISVCKFKCTSGYKPGKDNWSCVKTDELISLLNLLSILEITSAGTTYITNLILGTL